MNLPNRLTLARCVLAPIFLLVMLAGAPFCYGAALLIFIAASLTDLFDGRIARRRGLVTNLGKFLDPLADKMLTTFAFLGLMCVMVIGRWEQISLCWALALILAREFAVTSARLLAAKNGVVIAASMAGKVKTVMQMTAIIYMLVLLQGAQLFGAVLPGAVWFWGTVLGHLLVWAAAVLAVISGVQYIAGCKQYFRE